MKKFLTIAAMVLGLVACQNDEENINVGMDDVEMTINVKVAEETRTGSEEVIDGGIFGTDILDDANITMRYILQIYHVESDKVEKAERMILYSDENNGVCFDVRLAPDRDYKFVVWADVVNTTDAEGNFLNQDYHYNTADLENITRNEWGAMDETCDAFTAFILIEGFNGQKDPINLELERPFAKLRVQTTELSAAAMQPDQVKMTCKAIPESFNAYTGEASTTVADINYEYTIDTTVANAYGETKDSAKYTLFSDYLFVNSDTIECSLGLYNDGNKLKSMDINNVNVKPNTLTTVSGKLL